ncbi:hypothetical protein PHYSODRAFT_296717 [Phytophthora sojae]|uniref:Uncharacterized protein n=1 Tax=Phytophthora sojae (strain P6497) TaxID=1094619 RepID=G4YS39_PHYSP|nr:hypothetical protein PHYSODRAFT_296717 [Phytophthora sojae]EGZ24740.1 hypothetical protein PHYSODRAFT_296717 [Phytophthora sojae]|eukprot:XP_009520028.1 hypothetical protein PHYSODRAFT_296717 [Phytophthora sojae]
MPLSAAGFDFICFTSRFLAGIEVPLQKIKLLDLGPFRSLRAFTVRDRATYHRCLAFAAAFVALALVFLVLALLGALADFVHTLRARVGVCLTNNGGGLLAGLLPDNGSQVEWGSVGTVQIVEVRELTREILFFCDI